MKTMLLVLMDIQRALQRCLPLCICWFSTRILFQGFIPQENDHFTKILSDRCKKITIR